MNRAALEAALSQALFQQQETQEKLDEALREIELLKEINRLKSRLPFVPSTEQMELLFDEAELLSQPETEEPEELIHVTSYTKVKKKKHDLTTLPADTPVVDIYHELNEEPLCERCESATRQGEDRVVLKVAVQPKKYYIERHHYPTTECTRCDADEGELNRTTHWVNKKTDTLIASASLVADCAVRKYADGLPLYRQEAIFRREGFKVSRQTISNWLLTYMGLLEPLREHFKKHLFDSSLINQDETPLQVIHIPAPATSKSTFMFVQVGTTMTAELEHRLVLYTYIRNRQKVTLQAFTKGYNGYVMTDGLKEYLGIKNHLNCWVHAARGFKNIVKVNKKASGALEFITVINRLFKIEKGCRKKYDDPETFLVERKKLSMEVFDELKKLMDTSRPQYASKSPMGIAIEYLYTYWETLIAYVDCYEATPENNIAENAIRPYILGRKNWLFSNTEGGAEASAFYYSLIETAKANKINESDYLWYCLSEAPSLSSSEDWDRLLPWNIDKEQVDRLKRIRNSAFPDPNRTELYVLRGAH